MTLLRNEKGGSTAEFAIVLPAILLVFGVVLGGLTLSATRIALVSGAYDLARLEARGDSSLADSRSAQLPLGASTVLEHRGDLLCVTVTATPAEGLLRSLTLTATGCAVKSDYHL